ncbi:hypothetical protein EV356DRAFT_531159 [Viridothelium virens]|uniref:Translation initiation factor 3 C-terminal domain-containing protein n=1 Tax=Viridothelium virens TaxID=1048519 RepID=A0A6A6HDM1_VIRVR|nr:hypothetical protein EV356DRAFT_531159 [Viridothelium virens]
MHAAHLLTAKQALYRVFVLPFSLHYPPQSTVKLPLTVSRPLYPRIYRQCRPYAKYRPPIQRSQPYNEEIQSQYVCLVDVDGKLGPAVTLFDALRGFNRETHELVQVSQTPAAEPGTNQTNHPTPICKVISKDELRASERAKAKPKKSPDQSSKELEINWAIDRHDLQHRLKRLGEFLDQGRRVEVLLARKKSGRQATREEAEDLVNSLREKCEDVGGKESKPMEGRMGLMAKLHFEGVKGGK